MEFFGSFCTIYYSVGARAAPPVLLQKKMINLHWAFRVVSGWSIHIHASLHPTPPDNATQAGNLDILMRLRISIAMELELNSFVFHFLTKELKEGLVIFRLQNTVVHITSNY
jgi:hypothetical protein